MSADPADTVSSVPKGMGMFEGLKSSLDLGGMKLRNRMAMSAMGVEIAEEDGHARILSYDLAFAARRAEDHVVRLPFDG